MVKMGRVVFTAQDNSIGNAPLFRRRVVVWLLATLIASWSGCATTERPVTPVDAIAFSPRPSVATPVAAWKTAHAFAATRENAEVVLGLGDSMEPFYRNRTLLVVEKPPFAALEPGMTAVFIGPRGSLVAHSLVRRVRGGWEARGWGNTENDDVLVTPANFRGRVTLAIELALPGAALAADTRELRTPTETAPIANLVAATW